MAGFGQVDADLMLPSGFELAGDEGRPFQSLLHPDVRDGLPGGRGRSAARRPEPAPGAPQAISPVRHEQGVMGALLHRAVGDREIPADHGVLGELRLQMPLRLDVPGEDDEPRGLFIQTLNRPQGRTRRTPRRLHPPHRHPGEREQGVSVSPLEGDCQNSGRLANHHEVGVEMNHRLGGNGLPASRAIRGEPYLHLLTRHHPARWVAHDLAVHPYSARAAEVARLAPGRSWNELADQRRERQARLLFGDSMRPVLHFHSVVGYPATMASSDLSLPLARPHPATLGEELVAAARLAAPVAFVQLGTMLMGVVDTIMLGHHSAQALAAGALGHLSNIVFLLVGWGVLSALDPLVAQAYGARDSRAISAHLQRGIVLSLALVVPLAFIFWDLRRVFHVLGQPSEIIDGAAAYVRAILWGTPAYFLFMTLRQTLQAMGVVRPAAIAIIAGNLINVAGNWILIFGRWGAPALGPAGSAYATSLSRWAMLGYLLFASRRSLAPYWHGFTAEAVSLRRHLRLLRIGLPIGLLNFIELGLFASVALLMGHMGVAALGGHQIAINLASLSFMVPLGVSGAAATRVGNAIGREDMPGARRAAKACLMIGAGVMVGFALLFGFLPEQLARLYTRDAAVVAMAATLLPIAAVFQVLDGTQVVAAGILRGAADTTFPAAMAIVGFWGIGFPFSWYLGFRAGLGPVGLWWGFTAGLGAVTLLYLLRTLYHFRGEISREVG